MNITNFFEDSSVFNSRIYCSSHPEHLIDTIIMEKNNFSTRIGCSKCFCFMTENSSTKKRKIGEIVYFFRFSLKKCLLNYKNLLLTTFKQNLQEIFKLKPRVGLENYKILSRLYKKMLSEEDSFKKYIECCVIKSKAKLKDIFSAINEVEFVRNLKFFLSDITLDEEGNLNSTIANYIKAQINIFSKYLDEIQVLLSKFKREWRLEQVEIKWETSPIAQESTTNNFSTKSGNGSYTFGIQRKKRWRKRENLGLRIRNSKVSRFYYFNVNKK